MADLYSPCPTWTEEQLRRAFALLYPVPSELDERIRRRMQMRIGGGK